MIDLRSDTVTRPTEAMRHAMFKADVGDDGYGDDPSVNALEQQAAAIFGKEAALFVPSGTMGNLCAILAQTGRGDEIIVETGAHIYRSELGGCATIAGVPYRVLQGKGGMISLDVLRSELEGNGAYAGKLRPALICVETTHNASGGAVLPLEYLEAIKAIAADRGAAVHMDGARVFNAAAALSVEVSDIVRHADTVTFCLSKGLGAPVGSVLCGTQAAILRARQIRKMLGGTMRQAGILAAAGMVALENPIGRLVEDHRRARRLAAGLHALHPGICDPTLVASNIVFVDVAASARSALDWCKRLATRDIICRPYSKTTIRLLTHSNITDAAIERVLTAFSEDWPLVESHVA